MFNVLEICTKRLFFSSFDMQRFLSLFRSLLVLRGFIYPPEVAIVVAVLPCFRA